MELQNLFFVAKEPDQEFTDSPFSISGQCIQICLNYFKMRQNS